MELKKAKTSKEFKEQLDKFMRLQFEDEWEGSYCNEVYKIVLQYCQTRGLKIHGKLIENKGSCR